jgi:hypothetical protein
VVTAKNAATSGDTDGTSAAPGSRREDPMKAARK